MTCYMISKISSAVTIIFIIRILLPLLIFWIINIFDFFHINIYFNFDISYLYYQRRYKLCIYNYNLYFKSSIMFHLYMYFSSNVIITPVNYIDQSTVPSLSSLVFNKCTDSKFLNLSLTLLHKKECCQVYKENIFVSYIIWQLLVCFF